MQSVNSEQFLKFTPLFLLSNRFSALSVPSPVIVYFHLQVYKHHCNHINLT